MLRRGKDSCDIDVRAPLAQVFVYYRGSFGLKRQPSSENDGMLFILYYIVAITILVLHFTGFLARHNLEWLVLALAVTVFPAVIYL